MTNRLTISDDIQLFFRPDGTAWYSSRSGKPPEQIEAIVYQWQDDNLGHLQFDLSEQWLQAYEAPDRRREEILSELRRAYNAFREHMLRKFIAKEFYGNANDYNCIFAANRDKLESPDKIQAGQELVIPRMARILKLTE
jgi:hypothetical protein